MEDEQVTRDKNNPQALGLLIWIDFGAEIVTEKIKNHHRWTKLGGYIMFQLGIFEWEVPLILADEHFT